MHDRFSPNGVCSRSLDLFKFWEINGNISETVHDSQRYNLQVKANIGSRMWPIEWHHCG